jgi:hypothetical protein
MTFLYGLPEASLRILPRLSCENGVRFRASSLNPEELTAPLVIIA